MYYLFFLLNFVSINVLELPTINETCTVTGCGETETKRPSDIQLHVDFDICILRLATDVEFTDELRPICIPLELEVQKKIWVPACSAHHQARQVLYPGQVLPLRRRRGWGLLQRRRRFSSGLPGQDQDPVRAGWHCGVGHWLRHLARLPRHRLRQGQVWQQGNLPNCVKDVPAKRLVVGVADHNMQSTNDDEPGVTRLVSVQDITVHPDYNSRTLDSDIALITLSETLDLTQHKELRPVCLPADDSKTYAGMMATATGWGTLQSGGERPDILNEVSVPILEPSCPEMDITENMLCAGLEEGGKDTCGLEEGGKDTCQGDSGGPPHDTCQGDSGGPLYVEENSVRVQVGITSWGYGCADANSPGVYARVSKYVSWIKE
uniref:Prophenoloxidase activating factor serine proteinase n=1 Tax=Scylla serrata TaxID=6761 RepID=Q58I06_SCYSE|nr:prophenoloxidase activating factor serine proteinase [Scylla serrata]